MKPITNRPRCLHCKSTKHTTPVCPVLDSIIEYNETDQTYIVRCPKPACSQHPFEFFDRMAARACADQHTQNKACLIYEQTQYDFVPDPSTNGIKTLRRTPKPAEVPGELAQLNEQFRLHSQVVPKRVTSRELRRIAQVDKYLEQLRAYKPQSKFYANAKD